MAKKRSRKAKCLLNVGNVYVSGDHHHMRGDNGHEKPIIKNLSLFSSPPNGNFIELAPLSLSLSLSLHANPKVGSTLSHGYAKNPNIEKTKKKIIEENLN